jgi:excisionase family DNA binding protein
MGPTKVSAGAAVGSALLDAQDLAARLGVTVRFVRRLVEERRVPYVKIGRYVRFDPAEVDRWIIGNRIEPFRPASHRSPRISPRRIPVFAVGHRAVRQRWSRVPVKNSLSWLAVQTREVGLDSGERRRSRPVIVSVRS